MTDTPDMRIGHPERTQALEILSEHFANGYLDVHEFDDRSAKAAAATHRSHLTPLLSDLPTGTPSSATTDTSSALRSQHEAELELAEVQRKGALVRRFDSAIWGVAIIVMLVGIFTNFIPMWWIVFPIAGVGSWIARSVVGLEDDEEDIFEELEYDKEEARRERLEQAMKRRKELGY